MRTGRVFGSLLVLLLLLAANHTRAADISLDLQAALQQALRDNPELKAKRHSLGFAQGRLQQAGLLFQTNPRFSVETESQTSGKSATSVELNLHQELEIAGQRGYRSEAAFARAFKRVIGVPPGAVKRSSPDTSGVSLLT